MEHTDCLGRTKTMNAAQHTLRYRTEGDYSKLRAYVQPVEYTGHEVFPGTCEKCVFGRGQHTASCKYYEVEPLLRGIASIELK